MPGRFWAVGVGPGDPELLTLRAVDVLRRAHVIYHAGPGDKEGRAYEIIRGLLRPEQQTRVVLTEPMGVVSGSDWKTHYRPGVGQVAADCRRGLDVAFVTEGDPTLYSTAACVWQLLAEIDPVIAIEVIPGVSSITAAAARVGWPLAQKDEMLAVVPAAYHRADLRGVLQDFPSACFLKVPRALPELVEALWELGPQREAVYVENLGCGREWITHDLRSALGRNSYFSLVLVRRGPGHVKPQAAERGGRVSVVGLGPGDPSLLTGRALEMLREAEAVVGYEAYLASLAPLGLRAEMHPSPIGAEAERAALAVRLAGAGRRVVLVSSGDAGVYGMASLLLETAQEHPDIDVEVVPGVTAALAAAALLGAPLGHDFACVSLSDLLTPWEVIERRLEAVGQGDFVLAVYNPVSRRRTWQLPRARELLLKYRAAETPVGLVDRANRLGMRTWHATLGSLVPDGITMETVLIIGSSRTRMMNGRMVTPRGYHDGEPGAVAKPPAAETRVGGPGRQILQASFAIIERELGPHSLPGWAFAVVRRMVHASGDFEFARTLRHSDDFEGAIQAALRLGVPVVTDTEMVRLGVRSALADRPGVILACHLNDPETAQLVSAAGLTRSAAGIRRAARLYDTPVLAIGNAPTALEEALRLVEQDGWRPAAIVGMPVGFVGVEEAKSRLIGQSRVPYLSCTGRKGGSAVTAAAINALVECFSS